MTGTRVSKAFLIPSHAFHFDVGRLPGKFELFTVRMAEIGVANAAGARARERLQMEVLKKY